MRVTEIPFSATTFAVISALIIVLTALLLWAVVALFRALARLAHTADDTAHELTVLHERLEEIARLTAPDGQERAEDPDATDAPLESAEEPQEQRPPTSPE